MSKFKKRLKKVALAGAALYAGTKLKGAMDRKAMLAGADANEGFGQVAKKFVTKEFSYFFKKIFSLGTKLIRAGSKVKVIMNEVINPKVIIQPKSIIGFISLKTRDRNAMIVVKTVYKIGQNILFVVKLINSKILLSG